jgi:hypothetical protein
LRRKAEAGSVWLGKVVLVCHRVCHQKSSGFAGDFYLIKPGKSRFVLLPESLSGGLAQLGEHLLCKQGVVGSIPSSSTKLGL